jgi:hypothetical protein
MLTVAAILGQLLLFAFGPDSCVSDEQALRAVAHDLWLGYNRHDTALLATALDDQFVLVPSTGNVTTKPALLAHLEAPPEPMQSQSDEALDEVRTVFADHTALLNFRRHWTVTHRPSGVSFRATSRMTEVFVCRDGRWKVLAFQETLMQSARSPRPALRATMTTSAATASGQRATGPRSWSRVGRTPCSRLGDQTNRSSSCQANSIRSSRADSRSRSGSCAERGEGSSASFTPWATARSRRSAFGRPCAPSAASP